MLRKDPLNSALNPAVIKEFSMAKKFTDNKAAVSSLDYNMTGTFCITTSLDESLRIYDCLRGTREQVLYSKKYGCNLAQFTSQPGYVAYASTKINDTIRYLSFETNQYLRYFVGHSGFVTSLQRNPEGNFLMSAAMDGTVRLWDLNVVNPTGTVDIGGRNGGVSAAYDPSGMIVAVAVDSSQIQLLDIRELSRGAFSSWSIGSAKTTGGSSSPAVVSGIKFVPPLGDFLMLAMTDGTSQIWNTQTGDFVASLTSGGHAS
ncbi:WD repeat-containing protein 82, partial [Coemansia sp. RSA 2599]